MVKRNFALTMMVLMLSVVMALCPGCGGGGGGDVPTPPADTTGPTITASAANPSVLDTAGGNVTISAHVTDDVAVASVAATITKPDGTTQTLAMGGALDFSCVFTAPANISTDGNQTYYVKVTAADTSGNTSSGATIIFSVTSPDPPPPPPGY